MPSYKFTYFDARGRGEAIRLMFVLAGVDFEDKRITKEAWQVLKPNTRFGQLPILEVDGKQMAESVAIMNYLAREFGYYGKTNMDHFEIDQVMCLMEDFAHELVKSVHAPDDQKEKLTKHVNEVETPKYLTMLEGLLKESGTGYFVGDSLTVADVYISEIISQLQGFNPGCTDGFPLIQGLIERFENQDKVKAYRLK